MKNKRDVLERVPEKPLLSAGTRIKFSNGEIATIVKVNCNNMHCYTLMLGNRRIESIDWVNMKSIDFLDLRPINLLIDTTWEIIE